MYNIQELRNYPKHYNNNKLYILQYYCSGLLLILNDNLWLMTPSQVQSNKLLQELSLEEIPAEQDKTCS